MEANQFQIHSQVWIYPGIMGWHFASVPREESARILAIFGGLKKGWGSLPVKVTLGSMTWETSIFPDKKSQCYHLPIKALVRKKEGISSGNMVDFLLEIRV
jgi:hypothetical protein